MLKLYRTRKTSVAPQKATMQEITWDEMNKVYAAMGTLINELGKEHVAAYFKRPKHDPDTYKVWRQGVEHLRDLLSKVAADSE